MSMFVLKVWTLLNHLKLFLLEICKNCEKFKSFVLFEIIFKFPCSLLGYRLKVFLILLNKIMTIKMQCNLECH